MPDLRNCPNICLDGVTTATKHLSQDSRYSSRDSNRTPLEYKSAALSSESA
jgi:hypothetical protein